MNIGLAQKGYYMLNSSYLNAANPNTMRCLGASRNVQYNFEPQVDASSASSRIVSTRSSVMSGLPRGFFKVVRTNDYTKNISEPVFCPGMVSSNRSVRPKTAASTVNSTKRP